MSRIRAVYKDIVIAESDNSIEVEGNHYFPKTAVNFEFFQETETSTLCPWKGEAAYYSIIINEEVLEDACWYYPHPTDEAKRLQDHYAFWRGVEIIKETEQERLENTCTSVVKFMKGIVANTKGADKKCPKVHHEVRDFMANLNHETLTHTLPESYINDLSFFNFSNSTNSCFLTNHENKITKTNPTFNWTFDHMGSCEGMSLKELLNKMEVLDDTTLDEHMSVLNSHGWLKIPKIRVKKENGIYYYSLDVAIIKHGDIESLSGVQGQFIDITKEVELSQSVEDLLNNTGQGFMSFCGDFQVQEKYSEACTTFFHEKIQGANALELFYPHDIEMRENQKEVFDMVFSGLASIDIIGELLKKEILIEDKYLAIDYKWIPKSESNAINKMMVVLTDITKEKELENQIKADEERQKAILKVATDRDGYIETQKELESIFEILDIELKKEIQNIDVNALFRAYHSIKGGSAIFSFQDITTLAHEIESELDLYRSQSKTLDSKYVKKLIQDTKLLNAEYQNTIREFNKLLGINENNKKVYNLSKEKVHRCFTNLKMTLPEEFQNQVNIALNNITKEPIGPTLQKYKNTIEDLADRMQKDIQVELTGEDVEINKEALTPLLSSLIHLVRNSVDHGIELPENRTMFDKPEQGKIKICVENTSDNSINIVISDDGNGIDPNKIKMIALEKNIINNEWAKNASDQELIELIFHPGFSTKEEVSAVSGRGVGMDAVKVSVLELNGTIETKSQVGIGTNYKIHIPDVA